MAWIPSHTDLGQHPKLKRAARIGNVSEPCMIGHLHLLWWFALSIAPDGDLSRFDAHDLAIAAQWADDPDLFVKALRECGPSGSVGFLTDDMQLHDWDDYGGKYIAKVEAGRQNAKKRWDRRKEADSQSLPPSVVAEQMASQCEPNGLPMGTQWVTNAEERRGEEKNIGGKPQKRDPLWDAVIEACGWTGKTLTGSERGRTAKAVKELRAAKATEGQVRERTIAYRQAWPNMTLTPTALAANWTTLETVKPSAQPTYSDAGRGGVYYD
jgi:hypothetical protein